MSGGASLRDGHQDTAVVPPRVEMGAGERLGSKNKERGQRIVPTTNTAESFFFFRWSCRLAPRG